MHIFQKSFQLLGAKCTEGGRRGSTEQLAAITVVQGRDQGRESFPGRESFREGVVIWLTWKDR